jgi:hypothetical protein
MLDSFKPMKPEPKTPSIFLMGYDPPFFDINVKYVPQASQKIRMDAKEDLSKQATLACKQAKPAATRTRTTVKTAMMLLPLSRRMQRILASLQDREEVLGQLQWAPGRPFIFRGHTQKELDKIVWTIPLSSVPRWMVIERTSPFSCAHLC